jgi:hypothetical protein
MRSFRDGKDDDDGGGVVDVWRQIVERRRSADGRRRFLRGW